MVKDYRFWTIVLLLIITAILMYSVYTRILPLHFEIAGEFVHHWLSWAGVLYVAVFVPIFYSLKRYRPKNYRTLLGLHIFGNVLAFMFISIHFTQQISRPPQAYPDLGTGIVLYTTMLLMVLTGVMLRFAFFKAHYRSWRFIHTGSTLAFYLIILIHILHGLEFI